MYPAVCKCFICMYRTRSTSRTSSDLDSRAKGTDERLFFFFRGGFFYTPLMNATKSRERIDSRQLVPLLDISSLCGR